MSNKITNKQNVVLSSPERRVYLNAGAGTGKTSTILASIRKKIDEMVDARKILVLTFNKDIKQEISKKSS